VPTNSLYELLMERYQITITITTNMSDTHQLTRIQSIRIKLIIYVLVADNCDLHCIYVYIREF